LTDNTTLSEAFNADGSIASDIISDVQKGFRTAVDDVLVHSGMTEGPDGVVDAQTYELPAMDVFADGNVPSFDPEEFISYESPVMPAIMDFDASYEVVVDFGSELDSDMRPGYSVDSEAEEAITVGIESELAVQDVRSDADIDIEIPEALHFIEEDLPEQDDMVVEIPEISGLNEGLKKVDFDTFTFNEGFREKFPKIILIAAIVAVLVLLAYYVLH